MSWELLGWENVTEPSDVEIDRAVLEMRAARPVDVLDYAQRLVVLLGRRYEPSCVGEFRELELALLGADTYYSLLYL
jgi:hypothetical protein|tara:strand:- start:4849 stop:5079 length:231 start_codon:yes stop_codon:yes gene_type:complete